MADYTSPDCPWLLDETKFPNLKQRQDFVRDYARAGPHEDHMTDCAVNFQALMKEISIWRPVCNANWALWAIIQGRNREEHCLGQKDLILEGDSEGIGFNGPPEFDYMAYARQRAMLFWGDLAKSSTIGFEIPGAKMINDEIHT